MSILAALYSLYTQFFPPKASLTERNLPPQHGKVFIITGGSSGIGFELARILYHAGGRVYILTRTASSADRAISQIQKTTTTTNKTPGLLKFIPLDLADLTTVGPAVSAFLAVESTLHVLFNNAGIANAPPNSRTPQGLETHYGINCVGPYLLTRLLTPTLITTAASAPPNIVRVIWTSSILVDTTLTPTNGIKVSQLSNPDNDTNEHYAATKTGNWFLASEFHRRLFKDAGVVSITTNPGQLKTNIWRNAKWYMYYPLSPLYAKSVDGANTDLWAAFDEGISVGDGGRYAIPYGRWHTRLRGDLMNALKDEKDGGTGRAGVFWEWCEEKVKPWLEHED